MRNDALVLLTAAVVASVLASRPAGAQERANPHQNLGGRSCTSCHTTSDWSDVRFDHSRAGFPLRGQHLAVPCASCHDLRDFRGAVRDCASCHADPHRGDAGPECSRCHGETSWQVVSAQNAHARTRLPELGVHAALRCEDCHRQRGVQQFSSQVSPCAACHQGTYNATSNPSHPTLGFSTRCETCHQFTTWSFALFASHDATFGIYSGAHGGVWRDCGTCHTQQSDFKVFTCTACHTQAPMDRTHQGIPSYSWNSAQCLSCHPQGRGGDLGFHDARFPVLTGTHAGQWATCADCHTDPSSRRVYSCMGGACHPQAASDGFHTGITGYQYAAAQCYSCHPDGRAGTFAQHETIFPINSGTHAGQWATCADCHTDASTRAVYTCMGGACHPRATTDPFHGSMAGYQYAAAQCFSCHPDGRKGTFTQHDAIFPIFTGPHASRWATCATCHTNPATRAVFTCSGSGCHQRAQMDDTHKNIAGYAFDPVVCLSCHPTGRKP